MVDKEGAIITNKRVRLLVKWRVPLSINMSAINSEGP